MKRNSKGQFMSIPPEIRFWDKVEKTKKCWLWIGAKRKDGYGVICLDKKRNKYRAHRFVMEMKLKKKLLPSIKVLHKCDNPACVRPSHLFLGTQLDNLRDMFAKRRNSIYFGGKGEKNPGAKLTKKEVEEIRKKYIPWKYSQKQLALKYGVVQQTISRIINNKRYVN